MLGVAGMLMTSLPCCFDGRGWHHHKVHMNEVSALMPEIIASKKTEWEDIIKIQMGSAVVYLALQSFQNLKQ